MKARATLFKIGLLIVFGAVLVLAPTVVPLSYLYTVTDVVILALFAVSFNLLFGFAGLLSFGHAAYFGVGAYGCALLLSLYPSLPVMAAIGAGALAAAVIGGLIGLICVRRTGPYFAMLTMAFGMLVYLVAWKWRGITGGDDGFGSFVPATIWLPIVGSFKSGDLKLTYLGVLAVIVPVMAAVWATLAFTPYGNAVRSIRLNEERAAFLGFNVFAVKALNYTIACAVAGLAGALYAIAHDFISPQVAGLEMSNDVVMMTFIGGSQSFFGPIVGAIFFVIAGDQLSAVTERWQMIMGVIFIAMVMYVPGGFIGGVAKLFSRRPPSVSSSPRVTQWA